MEARGLRRRAPPEALRSYFQGLGEMHNHVLSALDRARDSYEGEEWEQLPEARQDRILSAPFHDARVATRSYNEDDWGRAVLEIRKGASERLQHEAWKLEIERIKKEQGKKKRGGRRMTETNLPVGTPRQRVEIIPTASAAKTSPQGSPKLEHGGGAEAEAASTEFRARAATAAGSLGRHPRGDRQSVEEILKLQKDIRRSEQAASPRLISTSTVEKVARLADDLIEERHEEAARRGSMPASSRSQFFPDSGGGDQGSTTDHPEPYQPALFATDVDSGAMTPAATPTLTSSFRSTRASESGSEQSTPRRPARATHVFRAQHTLNNYKGQRTSTAIETLKLLDDLEDAETETDSLVGGSDAERRTSALSTASRSTAVSNAYSAQSSRQPAASSSASSKAGRLLDALILEDDDDSDEDHHPSQALAVQDSRAAPKRESSTDAAAGQAYTSAAAPRPREPRQQAAEVGQQEQPRSSSPRSSRVAPQRASQRAGGSRVAPQRAATTTESVAAAAPVSESTAQRLASQRSAPRRAAPQRASHARVAPQRASSKSREPPSRSSDV